MKINYFSDLHLEFWPAHMPATDADIIIAAGDIGIAHQGVKWLKDIGKPVIYVAGNHEFYTQEYQSTLATLRKQCLGSHVHFLENDMLVYKGVRFLGCTLWTDLFRAGQSYAHEVGKIANDFKRIKFGHGNFDHYKFSLLHQRSLLWLEKQLAQPFPGKTVVVTHHAPTLKSWHDRSDNVVRLAYCNDFKTLLERNSIAAWFHGHVHAVNDYHIAGTWVLCNPRGYSEAKAVPGFCINKTVSI